MSRYPSGNVIFVSIIVLLTDLDLHGDYCYDGEWRRVPSLEGLQSRQTRVIKAKGGSSHQQSDVPVGQVSPVILHFQTGLLQAMPEEHVKSNGPEQ